MSREKGLLYGVGINDAEYQVITHAEVSGRREILHICKFYQTWKNMLRRCYSEKFLATRPTYQGCSVSDEWMLFSNFRLWMSCQDWKGKQLDKDLRSNGSREYSQDTCVFIPREINLFMTDQGKCRGDFPIGVTWHKRTKVFRASCNNPFNGRYEQIGVFSDPGSAHEAWRKRKHQHALRYADMQTDERIASALRNRYDAHKELI